MSRVALGGEKKSRWAAADASSSVCLKRGSYIFNRVRVLLTRLLTTVCCEYKKDLEEVRKANPAQSRWIYVALWKAIYTSTTRRWFPDFNLPVMQPRSGAPESARQAVFLQVYLSAPVWHTHTHIHTCIREHTHTDHWPSQGGSHFQLRVPFAAAGSDAAQWQNSLNTFGPTSATVISSVMAESDERWLRRRLTRA